MQLLTLFFPSFDKPFLIIPAHFYFTELFFLARSVLLQHVFY